MKIDLSNQVAIISGGSKGIGAATALQMARAGASVVVMYATDRNQAETIVRKIRSFGGSAMALRCRVEQYTACESVVKRVLQDFERIDILVNNAGIWEFGKIGRISPKEWERSLNINLTGTFNLCNLCAPHMKRKKYGRIINIASTAGQRGEADHSSYAASKGGIIAFTKSIASELAPHGIWVNAVAPGWVDTTMVAHVLKKPHLRNEILKAIPRRKIASPDEIAGPILFLASNLSNHIVGEILNVNGGSVLCG